MQPQKLCLKWNNHTVNLLSVLGSFQQKDILVDVTISCEGQNIKAHKMVLSACSPYFQSIFLENPCQHPIVIINGIKYEDITAILNFMYKGEVNVSQDGLSSFLQAAEALKVKGLAEVCGERKSTNSINQEAQHNEQSRPQRTDTPPRKKHRNRKRSLSDSNKSDDEGTARKHHREPSSPEVHELSGDESFTGDNTSNGPPFHSSPRVPQNIYSRSHQSSSNLGGEDDDDYEVEPSKLLEQTLTTDNVSMNNSSSDNNLRIERIMGNATEIESSNIQEPESPPDIKPIIDYGESSAGPSEGNLMLYSEHSQPGPSSVQDGSLLHDNSHAQENRMSMDAHRMCQEELKRMVRDLDKKIDAMMQQKSKKRDVVRHIPEIDLPVGSVAQLVEFEKKLKGDRDFCRFMVRYLYDAGSGKTERSFLLSITRKLLAQDVAMLYSRYGRKGKLPFMQFSSTLNVILAATTMRFKECEKEVLLDYFGRALAGASDWGGRRMRPSDMGSDLHPDSDSTSQKCVAKD